MPSRIFTASDLIGVSEGYTSGPTGTVVPVITSTSFGNIHIDGNDTSATPAAVSSTFTYLQLGTVDLTNFPSIPLIARITSLKLRIPQSVNLLAHSVGLALNLGTINVTALSPNPDVALVLPFFQQQIGDFTFSHLESETGVQSETIFTFDPPLTYVDFNASYTPVSLVLSITITSQGWGGADLTYTISYDGGWEFEVTYFESFSWYVNTHQEVVPGTAGLSTIVDSIVQVITGDSPPVGSTFYGTSDDFPTLADIPVYNWYNSVYNVWLPIPQIITPGTPPWVLSMPDINFTGDVAASFALESTFVYMLKPSGIYTLTPNKRHDTLYERLGAITTINVAIPEPFIKTAYMSDEDIG